MDYKKLTEQRNEINPFARLLGIRLTEIKEGYARAEMTVLPEHANPYGSCHGGCVFSLADVASGAAASSFGNIAVTLRTDYNYLKPASVGTKTAAIAKTEKAGKNIIVIRVEIIDMDHDELIGTSCFTYYKMDKKIEL